MKNIEKYKTEVLLKKLSVLDEKYRDAINTPRREHSWGYSMRAYHSNKVSNPPEWKYKERAEVISEELIKRCISFSTIYLRLKN